MATIELTNENVESIVTGNDVVIVDFWAPWCGPCKSFAPVFEAAAEKYPDIVFAKANVDEQQELAGHFAVRSIPTIILFREQVLLFSQAGALPQAGLESVIEQAQALDMNKVREEVAAQEKETAAQENAEPQQKQQTGS